MPAGTKHYEFLADVVSMQTRQVNLKGAGEIPLRRPAGQGGAADAASRIVVGEVRQEECLDLMIALSTGLPEMA